MAASSKSLAGGVTPAKANRWPNPLAWLGRVWSQALRPSTILSAKDIELTHRALKY